MCASRPICPTRCGSRTSATPAWHTAPQPRSSPGSTTIPASPCRSPPTGAPPAPPSSTPSTKPALTTGCPPRCSPTTPWACTTRLAGGKGGRNALETLLADLGIQQKHSRPNHPTTCGKVERFQQTLKKWLNARTPAHTLDALQAQLDEFTHTYNHNRPHRALNRTTPAAAYQRLPKATPEHNSARTHHRVRHDRIDKSGTVTLRHNGKLHHIGIGRAHKHTPVTILAADLDIRVIDTQTGELLRHLTLNPNTDYQPRNKPR